MLLFRNCYQNYTMILRNLFLFSASILIFACNSAPQKETDTSPQKIISLDAAATEMIYAVGLQDKLIGVDVTSTYPPEVKSVPVLGHTRNIKPEAMLALKPDMIIASDESLQPEVMQQFKDAGIRVFVLKREYTLNGAEQLVKTFCDTLQISENIQDSILHTMKSETADLSSFNQKPKVLFIYARAGGNLMTAGQNNSVDAFITLAGAENAVQGFDDYKVLSPESFVTANPDVILLFSTGKEALDAQGGLEQIPGYKNSAVQKNNAVIVMDGNLISSFGPRLGTALHAFRSELRNLGFK